MHIMHTGCIRLAPDCWSTSLALGKHDMMAQDLWKLLRLQAQKGSWSVYLAIAEMCEDPGIVLAHDTQVANDRDMEIDMLPARQH